MPVIAIALRAVILGNPQVQHHQLVTLARVLDGALVGGLDTHRTLLAVGTCRPGLGGGPDMNIAPPIDPLNDQIGQTQDRMILGYRYDLH